MCYRLFTILYEQTGRSTVLGKRYANFRTGKFRPGIDVYRLYESVPFIGKRPLETGIKDGFEEAEHEFPFEIFRPKKQDYLF